MRTAVAGCLVAAALLFATASPAGVEPLRAWAFVALGGVVGVLATRTWGRRVVGAALVLSGAGAAATAVGGDSAAAWVGALGGIVLCASGAGTFARGPSWRSLGARYDAPAARPATDADLWAAFDRGDDPTI